MPRVVMYYPVGIRLIASAECMIRPRAPTPPRCSVGCSVYRQCILEKCGGEIQYHPNHDTGCRTSVAIHNATVQQPFTTASPNSNPSNACSFQSRVNESMDALRTFHSSVNSTSGHRMMRNRLNLLCYGS
ncbi:hypothetical protein TNCV_812341 [Trichonephila clavipes]|nr:hypothetical protein TNCV_812341 [Trichonephila clavipes]